jgi:DNA-binding NtrC family response regulator
MSAEELADRVEKAHGGTLLLADVDTLDPGLRPVLVGGLDGRGLRLADSRTYPANVRLIASAEPELAPMALEDDFLARLSRVSLFLPPLRERRSDIPLLIRHVLDKHAAELDGPARRVPDDALVLLWQYDWPGNLRELAAVVRQAASAARDGVIRSNLLPAQIRWPYRRGTPADPARSGSEASNAPGKLANGERGPRFFAKVESH